MVTPQQSPVRYHPPPSDEGSHVVDTSFIWLDTCVDDYEKFKRQFCSETSVDPHQWSLFNNDTECRQFIENNVRPPQKCILVASGRLGAKIVGTVHEKEQLDSIYIYCRHVDKHKHLKETYKKISGIFNNPVELFTRLRENLDAETAQTPPKPRSSSVTDDGEHFSQPDTLWCPWQTGSCTRVLPARGQATIAIRQIEPIPCELILSNMSRLSEIDGENSYSIVMRVSKGEVSLSILVNGETQSLDRTTEPYQVLQSNDHRWHTYWVSFFKVNLVATLGLGEMRPKFKILEGHLNVKHASLISNISHVHIKIDGRYQNLEKINHWREKIQFWVGKEPLVVEPALLILRQSQFSRAQATLPPGISPSNLVEPCRLLYHSVTHFRLLDDDFLDLISAIEYSIKNPNGWCHQKLIEKANRFGRSNPAITNLRLTMDSFVIEIWPPGHYSPIHDHNDAYGIIRVLHGRIVIKLFPTLSLNPHQESLIELMLDKEQVTWMMPKLNQIHQMKNVDMYGSCCITIQSYFYEDSQRKQSEYFQYITNGGRHIEQCNPTSDLDFGTFKEKIKNEWENRNDPSTCSL